MGGPAIPAMRRWVGDTLTLLCQPDKPRTRPWRKPGVVDARDLERFVQSSARHPELTPGPAGLSASLSPQPASLAHGLRLPPSPRKKVHLGYHEAYSCGEPTMITTVTPINDGFRPRTREQVGPPADDFSPTAHEVLPPTRWSA